MKNFGDMFNRFDTIPAGDEQTDGQTSFHRIVRGMRTDCAVKTGLHIKIKLANNT